MPPYLYTKPKRTLIINLNNRGCRNEIFDILSSYIKGIEGECIQNHACECNNDRNDDSQRNDASCKSLVLKLVINAKHFSREKEISSSNQFF